ncbi:EamA family transporter [Xanthomonadaceae bacterium XH05]|nr:EamA family transporter [Xanthomonadaceae bacterium XH05]
MPLSHLLLALAVILVWGTNFVVIKIGLDEFPPLLYATARFLFSCLPWMLVVKRPRVPWRLLAGTGFFLGFGLFGLLFIAMRADITPGVASLVVQTQAFFTIVLAMLFLREKLRMFQIAGLMLCAGGLVILFAHVDGSLTVRGLVLTLTGGFCWGVANLLAKQAGKVDMLGFMVWSSIFALPPLLIASFWLEGAPAITSAVMHASWPAWGTAVWQGVANTLFGYGVWNWLLARHPATTVAPLSLLVPVVAMLSSAIVLGETLPAWKVEAAALLLAGLAVITLWPRWRRQI